jgi:cysteine-rich repeat protein
LGQSTTINATTAGSTENYTASCYNTSSTAPPAAPNVVYAITLTAGGVLNLTLSAAAGSTLLPALDIRTNCATPDFCSSSGTNSTTFSQDLPAGTYYVIVAGKPGTSGAFSLVASLTAATCGNGVVDPGEQCDPGAPFPANDGCNPPGTANQCQFIPAPVAEDKCPGQAVAVPMGTTVLALSQGMSTYGFKDDYFGTCAGAFGGANAADGGVGSGTSDGTGGPDRVFQLTPAKTGTMTVSVGYEIDGVTSYCGMNMGLATCWASVLYARTTCNVAQPELACAVGVSGTNLTPAKISFAVTANTPVWVFVDGLDGNNDSYGPFNLIVSLP